MKQRDPTTLVRITKQLRDQLAGIAADEDTTIRALVEKAVKNQYINP